ncbi:MAG: alpha/beta hydrolase [Chloroflexota bacterium]|nr:alpha/beta hydrolase [Chloroflexota bacterium]MDQ5865069.1 alpha/beta hydrolase [Chloroflexota bacterium]
MQTNPPTLVFIHGAGSNAGFWHEQQAAFPGAHFLTLPGHFDPHTRQVAGEGMRSIGEYADWVEGYVSAAGLGRVVLNGHSMGGAIALTLALRKPDWLCGLVLTGTGARLRVDQQLLELLRGDYSAAIDFIIARSFADAGEPLTYTQKARLNGTRRQLQRTPQSVTLADYEACDHFDVMAGLDGVAVPSMCIAGARDEMTPPRYSEYLAARIPGAWLLVVGDAGHMLPLEQSQQYNAALAEFTGSL